VVSLSLVLSSCTIDVSFDGDDHGDHDHEHDHGDEGETGIDHHGNPIFGEEERIYEVATADGVSVEFTVENFLGVGGRGGEVAPRLIAGEHAVLQFRVTDPGSGRELTGLNPAVWLDTSAGDEQCETRIQGYLSGAIDRRPLIDLNSYFILGMNRDNTISVIDPMIDVAGMTNLFSVVLLQASPQDWAMAPVASRLFVTLPDLSKIAVVDLAAFLVEDTIDLPGTPMHIALHPDGGSVWVTMQDGIGMIDANTLDLETKQIDGEGGPVAFNADGTIALVGRSDGIELIDSATIRSTSDITLDGGSAAIAFSRLTGQALVAGIDGSVTFIDPETGRSQARITLDPNVTDLAVSPDGRWAVAVNRSLDRGYVIDVPAAMLTHAVPVAGAPDQVTFTDDAAYIRTSESPSIVAIPLEEIDPMGDISVLTIPIGTMPPGTGDSTAALAIAPTPDGNALLIPNPVDDQIYFYTEGAQAALGGFQGHTLRPRAVAVVDRTLKEPSGGVYTGSIRIPDDGEFTVAFWLDEPSLTHCFSFTAKPAEGGSEVIETPPRVEILTQAQPSAGKPFTLELRLVDPDDGIPIGDVEAMVAVVIQANGSWSDRLVATPTGDSTYELPIVPPASGFYNVLLAVPELGLDFELIPKVTLQVSG
jgi:DNA-binding beta-propeller fold protein YncE